MLLHIGPHKTGTTTVQSAFDSNRDRLEALGIHYVGDRLQPTEAAKAVTGATPAGPARDAGLREWSELLRRARRSGARQVVLSSEFLCEADDTAARRILADFGDGPLRVVVTLRGLAKVLPSQWQQFVQIGITRSFEGWLSWVLARVDAERPPRFWVRHRHDLLVARWARLVGPENVTVVVSDSRSPDQLPREFADLTGVPADVLVPDVATYNRSLTWEEAEGIRRFNLEVARRDRERRAQGLPLSVLTSTQRLDAWRTVKLAPAAPHEHRIALPSSVVDEVARLAHRITDGVVGSGVEVRGPVDQLVAPPRAATWTPPPGDALPTPPAVEEVAERLMASGWASPAATA